MAESEASSFEPKAASAPLAPSPPSSPLRRFISAFAFGADSFTLSPCIKVVQGGANFH